MDTGKTGSGPLYLNHRFEGKPLYKDFIPNTMMGIEYLWGKPVKLETMELVEKPRARSPLFGTAIQPIKKDEKKKEPEYRRVLYTMENRKISKKSL